MKGRPNIVFICADQLGAAALGTHGNGFARTPVLDRLAREGAAFDRFYSNAPLCGPARFAMFTGQRPFGQGDWASPNCAAHPYLPYLGDRMRAAGYATASVGKLHGMPEDFDFGFERVRELSWPRNDYMHWLDERVEGHAEEAALRERIGPRGAPHENVRGNHVLPPELSEEAWIVDEAASFLAQRPADRPFFLHLGFKHPHAPFETRPRDEDRYGEDDVGLPPRLGDTAGKPVLEALDDGPKVPGGGRADGDLDALRGHRARYYTSVTEVDRAVGEVLELLERHGVREETVVVFTSDHGDMLGTFGRGGKAVMYEDAARVPLIIRGPGVPAGARPDALAEQIDLLPTFLAIADAGVLDELPGTSLLPAARGEAIAKDAVHGWLVAGGLCQQMTVRGRYKLYRLHGIPNMQGRGIPDAFELYDLEADPAETANVLDTARDGEARAVKEAFCEHFWAHAGVIGCGLETRRRLLGDEAAEAFLDRYRPARAR